MWLAEKGGDLYHHPYDLGVYENLISVRSLRTTFCAAFLRLSLSV
jgi:palmitoyltransferase